MRPAFWASLAAGVTLGVTAAAQNPAPSPLSEAVKSMIVVTDGPETTLYAANPDDGLYSTTWRGAPPAVIEYATLKRTDTGAIERPIALSQSRDHLFLLDASRVIKWPARARLAGDPIDVTALSGMTEPMSLAVSPEGEVFVGDARERSIQHVRRGAGMQTVATALTPTSMNFVGRELQAFDRDAAAVYFLPEILDRERPGTPRRLPTFETSTVHGRLGAVSSAVNHRGVYYLASPDGVLVQSAGRSSPLALTTVAATALAVTDDYVFIAERDAIRVRPRMVPATFSFEGTRDESTVLAVAVYEYLASREVLRSRTITADRTYAMLDELLVAQRILPGPLPAASQRAAGANVAADPRKRLDAALCRIDASNCGRTSAQRPLAAGTTVAVPDVALGSDLRLSPVDLRGRPVKDHLDERIAVARDREDIDADYLMSVNRASSLELALTQKPFHLTIAAPGRGDLTPGTVIYLNDEREFVKNDLRSYCGIDVRPTVGEPFALPPHLISREVSAYLPRRQPFDRPPVLPGVDTVEFEFGDAVNEQVTVAAVDEALATPEVRTCLQALVPSETIQNGAGERLTNALVVSALRVKHARYRFRRADGTPAPLTAADLQERGILGRYDVKQQALEYDQPFYIAYRSVPWSIVVAGAIGNELASAPNVRTAQDIFKMRRGRLLLPATVWRLEALVPAREVGDDASALNALRRGRSVLRIAAAGSGSAIPQASGRLAADPKPSIEDVAADREHLFSVIGYERALAMVAEPLRIGVAERRRSINEFHPDFMDAAGRSAWQRSLSPTKYEPMQAPEVPAPVAATVGDFAEDDHGNHVAGILASRASSPAPGLMPTARLFLLDTTDLGNLPIDLQKLDTLQVSTFNFSNKMEGANIKCDKKCLEAARDQISTTTDTAVYVVAAGNEGLQLDDQDKTFPPLGWLVKFKQNMIGVAATTFDGKMLLKTAKDAHNHPIDASNYGPRFVQLAAPGEGLYGPLNSAGTYGDASGTSAAVPQVAATVELLRRSTYGVSLGPAQLKARLIYTSKWMPSFEGAVWGGLLDMRRALLRPDSNVLANHTEPDRLFRIRWDSDAEVTIAKVPVAKIYRADLDPRPPQHGPDTIPFSRVLRIEYVPEQNRYRVIYLTATNDLTILHNVQLTGELSCLTLEEWNAAANDFVHSTYYPGCRIPIQQIRDYVAKTPTAVRFP